MWIAPWRARQARAVMLEGRTPRGAARVVLGRRGAPGASTEEMLEKAREEAVLPKVLRPTDDDGPRHAPAALHPEAAAALEGQLIRPGDVSTVFAEWDRFTVYRLIERTDEAWTVEAVTFPKRDFGAWFQEVAGAHAAEWVTMP